MEIKKFRNHFSYVIEQLGGSFVICLFLLWQLVPDLIGDTENDIVKSAKGMGILPVYTAVVLIFLLIFGLIVAFYVRRWYKTWITISGETLTVERNTIRSVKNTVGIKNISNVNLNQNLFEMLIGTCNLKLNTNSLSTADSTDIKLILKKKQGEELKQFLNRRIEELNTGIVIENEQEEVSNDKYDIEVTIKDIIKNGLLSLYGGTILMVLGSFLALVADIVSDLGEAMKLGGIIAFILLILSGVFTLVKNILKMYDFKVRRENNKIHIKYGLYNRVDFAIPVNKINAIVIHQTFIARIFRKYSAEIINVGINDDDKTSAYFTFYCSKKQLKEYMDKLLPEFSEGLTESISKQPKRTLMRHGLEYLIQMAVLVLFSGSILYYGKLSKVYHISVIAVSILLVVILLFTKILDYKTCGIFIGKDLIGVKDGILGTQYAMIKYKNIQYVTLKQNILEKKLGIVRGGLHILASTTHGSHLLPYIDENYGDLIYKKFI